MKITVIMASYLSIPGRSNLDSKFKRAVNSFLNQTYGDKELIIVSDGCDKTNGMYEKFYSSKDNVKIISIPKQVPYSGVMRNVAFQIADGDIICYLDADDIFGKNHLSVIADQFSDEVDWIYSDDYMTLDENFKKLHIREVLPRYGSIGTSSIAHRNLKNLKDGHSVHWTDGYGHDFLFAMKLNAMGYKFKKLEKMPQYIVCHYHNFDV